MAEAPLVSVVVPCFDAAAMIAGCIESCRTQTYPNLEVIVVDNNSTDDGPRIARDIAGDALDLRVVPCPTQGVAHARNLGFDHARGEFIQWLDADDALEPEKIARQVAVLVADPDAEVAYGDWEWRFWEDGARTRTDRVAEAPYGDFLLELLVNNWWPPACYLLRRRLAGRLHRASAWNPDTRFAEDREYFTIAALWGARFVYAPGAVAIYNTWSDTQATRRIEPIERIRSVIGIFDRLQARVVAGEAGPLDDTHRALLNRDWSLWAVEPNRFSVDRDDQGQYTIRDARSGKSVVVSRNVAFVAHVVIRVEGAATLELFALEVSAADVRWRSRHLEVLGILEQFGRWGLMRRVADARHRDTTGGAA